ncbi:hypothetical protein TSTA_068130 [Talaromyces stipitatus ATCC 10500]|uniref:Uncharacterized protein n=1 Tax=Talaromyces stipitatus (strain ATCC 10500 / CBS 375.48 / QM 6759 / NRRL 1006) TaxID=441959 RepID=B8LYM8_TALSN|nr:uncharacterized protein TSTA_068130 [Talaromyces stipitatus ATCC 10500]EED23386.1 hypothetical protein TSTA_068130 [Talaromyces stipitatus ATCC 10500]
MESGVSAALSLGAEAIKKLNGLLEDKQTAKAWYGDVYDLFTSNQWRFWNGRRINRVFVIKKEDWVPVIRKWLPHTNGECSWLHIYWAIHESRLKHNKFNKLRLYSGLLEIPYLESAMSSLSSIGSISSLPAANLDSWGLIVLALANGADVDYEDSGKGGFVASLEARNFIITIQRDNVATQMTGHLEPRDHPEPGCRVISEQKWTNLLWYGHTFEEDDPTMSWPRINEQGGPPEDLVDGKLDAALHNTVMDDARRKVLADKLRGCIRECHNAWEEVEKEIGLFDYGDAAEIDMIKENLRKKKVILCDDRKTDFALEQTPQDTCDYAHSQLDQAEKYKGKFRRGDLVKMHKEVYDTPQKYKYQITGHKHRLGIALQTDQTVKDM